MTRSDFIFMLMRRRMTKLWLAFRSAFLLFVRGASQCIGPILFAELVLSSREYHSKRMIQQQPTISKALYIWDRKPSMVTNFFLFDTSCPSCGLVQHCWTFRKRDRCPAKKKTSFLQGKQFEEKHYFPEICKDERLIDPRTVLDV